MQNQATQNKAKDIKTKPEMLGNKQLMTYDDCLETFQ